MKSFVRYTSLVLALLFLSVAASAWTDIFAHGEFSANPLVKPAAGWSLTGLMFLAVGLRGWRGRKSKQTERTESQV